MFGGLIPEGPLHPEDAVWGLVAGAVAAAIGRRAPTRWPVAVIVAAMVVVRLRPTTGMVRAVLDHDRAGSVVVALIMVGVLGAVRAVRTEAAAAATLAATAVVWGIVPDTEVPLLVGATVLAACAALPWRTRSRAAALLGVLPVGAAAVGTLGRPQRLEPALGAASAAGVMAIILVLMIGRMARRQRAGTPTTVLPASTSSTTTAPAPTRAP